MMKKERTTIPIKIDAQNSNVIIYHSMDKKGTMLL